MNSQILLHLLNKLFSVARNQFVMYGMILESKVIFWNDMHDSLQVVVLHGRCVEQHLDMNTIDSIDKQDS